MEKYKNPFEIYRPYNRYQDEEENFGYGNYGYNGGYNGGYNQNQYPKPRYDNHHQPRYKNKPMKVPVQMPKEDPSGMHEWDKKKIKGLYPEICKRIQYYVEEICDKMDHSSSFMYDEYPEREVIEMTIDKIYEKVEKDDEVMKEFRDSMDEKAYDYKMDSSKYYKKPYRWLRHLIQILFLNEICGRRRKRCKRKPRRSLCYKPQPYYYRYPNFFE